MKKAKSLLKNWLLPSKNLWITKKKKLTLFLFCVLQTAFYKSQIANYITNGGFEVMYNCNGFDKTANIAKGWRNIDSSIFGTNVLNAFCYSYVPNNGLTYQWPYKGNNDVQLTVLCQTPQCAPNPNRGYIRNRLKSNLINGKIYCVKFYANVSNPTSYGISNLGAFFGDNSIDTITYINIPLTYINPQVENPTANILTDTMNWVPITGTFVANGTEKNCVIGNFRSDAATTKTLINSAMLPIIGCDILIDDVSCIPLDLPAYAGPDVWVIPGNTVYIGRPQDVGIDEACAWYNLTNTTTPVANAAGFSLTVSAVTATYMVKQDICGVIKYDTVVVHASALGVNELKIKNDNLIISPNPTSDKLNIQFTISDLDKEFTKAEIINSIGQLIKVIDLNYTDNAAVISTNELPAGVYHLLVKSQNQSINRRFVIAR